jgi:putative transposase
MNVLRSSYYDWLHKPKTDRGVENEKLTELIKEIFDKSRQSYGTRRIKKELAK